MCGDEIMNIIAQANQPIFHDSALPLIVDESDHRADAALEPPRDCPEVKVKWICEVPDNCRTFGCRYTERKPSRAAFEVGSLALNTYATCCAD